MNTNLTELPGDLPVPVDDGKAAHLLGAKLPPIALEATNGQRITLSSWPRRAVVFCYPRTGQPGVPLPDGWDQFPGARGCTPQACSFRDRYAELTSHDIDVFGLSTQDSLYQKEVIERLHVPFPILSDCDFEFTSAMQLPMFTIASMRLLKRLTFIANHGVIEKVFYPVFPPNKNVEEVLAWLTQY